MFSQRKRQRDFSRLFSNLDTGEIVLVRRVEHIGTLTRSIDGERDE
jgi:hypothetical protein